MRSYEWNGHLIEVKLRPFGIFLWLAYGLEVRVGERIFLPEFDRLSLSGTHTDFDIELQSGSQISGRAKTLAPIWFLPYTKCSISVDNTVIARDIFTLHRWHLTYLVGFLMITILLLALLGLIFLILIVHVMTTR
jgi:hypothetical protein